MGLVGVLVNIREGAANPQKDTKSAGFWFKDGAKQS